MGNYEQLKQAVADVIKIKREPRNYRENIAKRVEHDCFNRGSQQNLCWHSK